MINCTEYLKVFPTVVSSKQNFSKFQQNKISPIEKKSFKWNKINPNSALR